MKLVLLGTAFVLLLSCRPRKFHWAIAAPFAWLIAWAGVCWIVAGAGMLPARNLVSSYGGLLVLAALCAAADTLGGIVPIVRLLVSALVVGIGISCLLGVLGLQALPGQLASPWQLEWFHGIGTAAYMVAGAAVLIAWVMARHLTRPTPWTELYVFLLFIIPALVFLRTFLAGISVSIGAAAFVAMRLLRVRKKLGREPIDFAYKRLVLLMLVMVLIGAVAAFLKSSTREQGELLSGRELIWPIEIASVIRHPVFGLGPFGDVELLRFSEDLPQLGAAHSEFLGAAVCYGIPGLVLFCATLLGVYRRVLRFEPATRQEAACRYAAIFGLAGLATTSLAENVIRDPRLFAVFFLFPSMCLSLAKARQQRGAVR